MPAEEPRSKSSLHADLTRRLRQASTSVVNSNPQLGVWQATGTVIAQAPNLTELRDAGSGANHIEFNAQGHSARHVVQGGSELVLAKAYPQQVSFASPNDERSGNSQPKYVPLKGHAEAVAVAPAGVHDVSHSCKDRFQTLARRKSLHEKHRAASKQKWGPTIVTGLKVFWRFFKTPSGFLIMIYSLNIVAWGAMLFFLLLKAAPAMNHPSANDDNSPRKIWIEIDSQILNALFCVTGFGLAPWRFRDCHLFIRATCYKDVAAMQSWAKQNKAWFRAPAWAIGESASVESTMTGEQALPTPIWKLGFTVWMMFLNTALQAVLCYFMWGYNRFDRPNWATGTFIGLGCGTAMLAGVMSWWEGRKVKKIEGPEIKITMVEMA